MTLLHCSYSIVSVVDQIHRRLGYSGGKLELAQMFDEFPGFSLAPVSKNALPRHALAAMVRRGGIATIAFDPEQDRRRLRFSIAHEIGHALLHAGHLREFRIPQRSRNPESVRERQANYFAGELLAPPWAVELALDSMIGTLEFPACPSFPLLRQLADHFDVSVAAIRYQYAGFASLRQGPAGLRP